ncbi:hypothetical protein, partial [Streptomyces sp. SolWspMP-sol7th]|uniref:hypothetical protein n=1 Tax=Streptomyces sp. SolWspMP-sol7th TaxID=1839776 RepID=UPI0020C766EC
MDQRRLDRDRTRFRDAPVQLVQAQPQAAAARGRLEDRVHRERKAVHRGVLQAGERDAGQVRGPHRGTRRVTRVRGQEPRGLRDEVA